MSKVTQKRHDECIARLREWVKPGDTVYCILKHRSASGMSRVIDLYLYHEGDMLRISPWAADLLEGYNDKHEGCKAGGCGMDMGFHLVSNLGYALFPDGFDCIGEGCPSNDHFNRHETSHHKQGGYALKHKWL